MPPWSFCRVLLAPVAVLVLLFAQPWLNPWELLVDPVQWVQHHPGATFGGPPFYLGLLSTVGGLVMWTSAVACVFAGTLLRRLGDRRGGAFLLSAGAFSGLLALDDLLLIHDGYLMHFHVSEVVTLGAYGMYFLGHLVVFRREILTREYGLLALALLLLGGSAGIDVLGGDTPIWGYTEDSLKFLGLCTWTAFHCRVAWLSVRPESRHAGDLGSGPRSLAPHPVAGPQAATTSQPSAPTIASRRVARDQESH